ncbi:PulJ/GspJ family protein [Niabella hibiscisoli]|uniref:PulJ/GspJ family protein n=1 Tax=Niabella hibiscisoli TaxID=1825928 RepID=UPI001F0F0FC8|nr:prepilin-type N-terminal cleavage/methylation domain-containing protein [Niabella hibiscisoli]MCH5718174.1 prepilin-type N-terminal cleavage/methylation domain-containing protein [Niabella hibiscisoli]
MNPTCYHKKLSAFTLPEMVISLLIMSIVFATGFAVYMIVNKQVRNMEEKNSFYTDYFLTKSVLQRDFSRPGLITISDDRKKLTISAPGGGANSDQPLEIYLDSNYVLRAQGDRIDTLKPGATIESISFMQDTLSLVTFVKMRTIYHQKAFFTYLQKDYSAAEMLSVANKNLQTSE